MKKLLVLFFLLMATTVHAADTKVSALTELATTPAASDEFYINDGGTSKKIQYSNIMAGEATTAAALAANPAAATSGSCITNIAANGDVEAEVDVWTEAENTSAAYAPLTAPTFETSITGNYLTASEIVITDASKNIVSGAVATYPSLAELAYVKGVSSAIQTQINARGVGGSDTQVQFNDGGVFGGDSDLIWNKTTNTMTLGGTASILAGTGSSGVLTLGGVGGTNNEDLTFDFETTANQLEVGSGSGVTTTMWDGDFVVRQEGDALVPGISDTDPHIRAHSADVGVATDYIEMYHDQTNGILDVGSGNIVIPDGTVLQVNSTGDDKNIKVYNDDTNGFIESSANNLVFKTPAALVLDAGFAYLYFKDSGTTTFGLKADADNYDQFLMNPYDAGGNQVVMANGNLITKDFDHPLQTDTTLFLQSDTDPNVSNNQWISLNHDQENGIITTGVNTGTGSAPTTDENGIKFAPRGVLGPQVGGDGGLVPKFITGDPCAVMQEGAIFYNDTSDYMCYCNGAGADLKMNDNTTACF